jgi:hypothetical protein
MAGMKAHGSAALIALLLGLAAATGGALAAPGGLSGGPGSGVSYTLSPERPSELDDIVVNAHVSHDFCFTVTGVELGLGTDIVDVTVHADEGEVCAFGGPVFEERLPVPIGRLAVGTYEIEVSFEVCGESSCTEGAIGSEFDVVPIGDASCDLTVNAIDATVVLQSAAQLIEHPPCETAADTNQDGNVQSTDATLVLQYTAGLLDQLPPG